MEPKASDCNESHLMLHIQEPGITQRPKKYTNTMIPSIASFHHAKTKAFDCSISYVILGLVCIS